MNRKNFMWLLECCLMSSGGVTKKQMIELGASPEVAEAGIKLYEYLSHKELTS